MVPNPKNEEIKIEERRARQNPWRTPNIPLLSQHDADTSSLDEDVGKLQMKTQVCHIPSSLRKEKKNNRKTRKTHQTRELPNYKKNLGASSRSSPGTNFQLLPETKKEVWLPISKRQQVIKYQPRSPIPRLKLIIVGVLWLSHMIKMNEFVLPDDITIIGRHLHYHARDDDPPSVGH